MLKPPSWLAPLLLGLLGACGKPPAAGPIAVDVIGRGSARPDPNRGPLSTPDAVLLGATAEGLVRFDAAGQIVAGLARRWDVSNDGLYYTFRLRDGRRPAADLVAHRLRAALRDPRNSLQPLLGAVAELVAVTPEVIEIRLSAPRPHLLELLAQPELTVAGPHGGDGGPLRVDHGMLVPPAGQADDDAPAADPVRLTTARAALAVARFAAGRTDLVLGGGWADLLVARAARLPPGVLRFDPVEGMLGLAVTRPVGILARAEGRRALALAIDRTRIVRLIDAPGQKVEEALTATTPDPAPMAERREAALALIAPIRQPAPLRIALPDGPGAGLLFALLRQDFATVGVAAERVAAGSAADLVLIDRVAPADEAVWRLRRFTCAQSPVCSPAADAELAAGRAAATLAERDRHLARAAAALDAVTPYLAIATPVRWSLAAPMLDRFVENRRAAHPLDQLRSPPRR